MNSKKTILVAGGDLRFVYTAHALAADFEVYAAGFPQQIVPFSDVRLTGAVGDGLPVCDILVLPMPVSDDGVLVHAPFAQQALSLHKLLAAVRQDGIVLGGAFGKAAAVFQDAHIRTGDYLKEEELAVLNAVPTAEGALQILLEELPHTISGCRILVLGFGRIGSRLAQMLHALGARVTVVSRDTAELARAEMAGCSAVSLSQLPECAAEFPVVCNTIPARVVDEPVLQRMAADTLVLDLASKPGGVDLEAAQEYGTRVVWALSLPGKTAPVTAGEILARTIRHMLKERGIC